MTEKEQYMFNALIEKTNLLVVETALQKMQLVELRKELGDVYREMADLNYSRSLLPIEVEMNTIGLVIPPKDIKFKRPHK